MLFNVRQFGFSSWVITLVALALGLGGLATAFDALFSRLRPSAQSRWIDSIEGRVPDVGVEVWGVDVS